MNQGDSHPDNALDHFSAYVSSTEKLPDISLWSPHLYVKSFEMDSNFSIARFPLRIRLGCSQCQPSYVTPGCQLCLLCLCVLNLEPSDFLVVISCWAGPSSTPWRNSNGAWDKEAFDFLHSINNWT